MFNAGIRPAINAGISVSRVGGAAQTPGIKSVAGKLRLDLAQYRELEAFSQFASDLDKATQDQLKRGQKLIEVLKQPQYQPLSVPEQYTILYAVNKGILDDVETDRIAEFKREWFINLKGIIPEIQQKLASAQKPSEEDVKTIENELKKFKETRFAD